MKLELKHITPYLPFRLKAEMLDYKRDYVGKQYDEIIGVHQWSKKNDWCLLTDGGSKPSLDCIKPILISLSDITKEIEHNGERFVPIEKLKEMYNDMPDSYIKHLRFIKFDDQFTLFGLEEDDSHEVSMPYSLYEKLFEWHFDIFGLIDAGLAVDINSIKK